MFLAKFLLLRSPFLGLLDGAIRSDFDNFCPTTFDNLVILVHGALQVSNPLGLAKSCFAKDHLQRKRVRFLFAMVIK